MLDLFAVEHAHHGTLSARFSGDIDIVGTGLLQCQANKLATPLNAVPVVELVSHIAAFICLRCECRVPLTPWLCSAPSPAGRKKGDAAPKRARGMRAAALQLARR